MTKKAGDNLLDRSGNAGQFNAPEVDEGDAKLAELLSRIERLAGVVGTSDEATIEDVREPKSDDIRAQIEQLVSGPATLPSQLTPSHSTSHSTPSHSTPSHSTPSHSTPSHSTPAHSTPAHSTPAHSTPAHSTPSQPTPRPMDNRAPSNNPLPRATGVSDGSEFFPQEPSSLQDAGLVESQVEQLILKSLLGKGESSGRDIADQVKLPFVLVDELLRRMKYDQLLTYRDSAPMNDYIYEMTDVGRERGRRFSEVCSYYGSAPVVMADYIQSVKAQSLERQHPTVAELRGAFSDLLINEKMLQRLGPAINSGRGLFLFGAPGNGKTSIAERITKAFGDTIWIPRAIGVDGEVMRLFDPVNHEEVPLADSTGLLNQNRVDRRWIRIKRPTIVVGGELTMDSLEVTMNRETGISESPIQLKSNCGTLVIDDFGRQRMTTDELLNRWIVPLEKRYDFLNLANGKKLQVPFDQLIIFSTNLEPSDLVDEAFLRRIPYKIEVLDPSEEDFRSLFKIMCSQLGFVHNQASIDHLIAQHYKKVDRPFRK